MNPKGRKEMVSLHQSGVTGSQTNKRCPRIEARCEITAYPNRLNGLGFMTTLLLPCGGLGTRLGQSGKAKALAPIKGKLLLDVILDKIGDLFEEILIVSSPNHEQEFISYLGTRTNLRASRVVVQETPMGSLNAVTTGGRVLSQDCVVVWGDQIGVSRSTIELVLSIKSLGYSLIVPTIFTQHPYVWLNFSPNLHHVLSIGRQRDGDHTEKGWADLGVFYFSADALSGLRLIEDELTASLRDREIDLTYAIPLLSKEFQSHFPIRTDTFELLAVNTPEDLRIAEEYIHE
jgi:dTDP-glucose pyrophosphorylase